MKLKQLTALLLAVLSFCTFLGATPIVAEEIPNLPTVIEEVATTETPTTPTAGEEEPPVVPIEFSTTVKFEYVGSGSKESFTPPTDQVLTSDLTLIEEPTTPKADDTVTENDIIYTFKGWYTDKENTESEVDFNFSFFNATQNSDITIYGLWTAQAVEPTPSEEPTPSTEPTPSEEPTPSTEPTPSEEPTPSTEPTPSEEPQGELPPAEEVLPELYIADAPALIATDYTVSQFSEFGLSSARMVYPSKTFSGWYGKRIRITGTTPDPYGQRIVYCIDLPADLGAMNTGYIETPLDDATRDRYTFMDYYGRYLNVAGIASTLVAELYVQIMIWEDQGNVPSSLSGPINMTEYNNFKNAVNAEVNKFYTVPSFNGQTVTLDLGESITLTDTNGSLSNYSDTPIYNNSGVTVSKSGNQVTLTASGTPNPNGIIRFGYNVDVFYWDISPGMIYDAPTTQDVASVGFGRDPMRIELNVVVNLNGSLRIAKTSEDGIVSGLQFRVTGTGVDTTVTTGADGSITIPDLTPGTYTVTEVNTPSKYVQPASQPVTIVANETATVSFNNVLARASVQVNKVSTDGTALTGMIAEVYNDVNNNKTYEAGVDTLAGQMTGSTTYTLDNLTLGDYLFIEKTAPTGHIIDSTVYPFSLTANGQTAVISNNGTTTFTNDTTKLQISKTDIVTGEELEGASLRIEDLSGTVLYEWVSTTTPHYIERIPVGTYKLIETFAPAGYLVANEIQFEVTATGVLQQVHMEDDFTKVEISKTDIVTGEELPGAELHIEDLNGNILYEWTSTDTPHYIERIPVGKYKLVEDLAPLGYLVANEVEFEVTSTGVLQQVHMEDDFTKVEISKREIGLSEELPGAKLHIEDVDGNIVYEWTSSDKPFYIERLPIGTYYLVEDLAPIGYLIANTIEFEVTATDIVQEVIMYDEPIMNILRYSKADKFGGALLANATYGIFTLDDVLVQEVTTDETGYAVSEPLRYGEYYLQEMIAPDRFEIDPTKHYFSITDITEESIPTLAVADDPKIGGMTMSYTEKHIPSTPYTGDDFKVLPYALLAISVLGISILFFVGRKNNRKSHKDK